jgi:PIN domain nuclease of toxin-antitoxin system
MRPSDGVVIDTHAIIWYLARDARLSRAAEVALDEATASGAIYLPSICIVELIYLIEKGRLPVQAQQRLLAAIDDPMTRCRLVPLDRSVLDSVDVIKRSDVPDLPDRIIAATAVSLGLPLVTGDGRLRGSQVQTIW